MTDMMIEKIKTFPSLYLNESAQRTILKVLSFSTITVEKINSCPNLTESRHLFCSNVLSYDCFETAFGTDCQI